MKTLTTIIVSSILSMFSHLSIAEAVTDFKIIPKQFFSNATKILFVDELDDLYSIEGLKNISLVKVATGIRQVFPVGRSEFIVVDKKGKIQSLFGYSEEEIKKFEKDFNIVFDPIPNNNFGEIKKVASNGVTSVLLTSDGELSIWGANGDGFSLNPKSPIRNVSDVYLSKKSFLLVNANNQLEFWGDQDCGGSINNSKIIKNSKKFEKIVSNDCSFLILNEKGEAYNSQNEQTFSGVRKIDKTSSYSFVQTDKNIFIFGDDLIGLDEENVTSLSNQVSIDRSQYQDIQFFNEIIIAKNQSSIPPKMQFYLLMPIAPQVALSKDVFELALSNSITDIKLAGSQLVVLFDDARVLIYDLFMGQKKSFFYSPTDVGFKKVFTNRDLILLLSKTGKVSRFNKDSTFEILTNSNKIAVDLVINEDMAIIRYSDGSFGVVN